MQDVADFISSQPPVPHELFLPRDRIFAMEGRIFGQIGTIRDPKLLPYLEKFADSPNEYLRLSAVDAMRAIGSFETSAVLLTKLDDSNLDVAFGAMHGLIELAGGDLELDRVPSIEQFRSSPASYAAKCRSWWNSEGSRLAAVRASQKISH